MPRGAIDALTSPTLKYLRERWWNDEFTEFVVETLRPRAGNRILDVGCGEGQAEIRIGHLHLSQIRLFGIDIMIERVMVARRETAAHNQRVRFATADTCALPFRDGAFDSTFCVAVLQHIREVDSAVTELARVTAAGGRVVAVEPDNSARYFYSSVPEGMTAFEMSSRFFSALAAARGDSVTGAVGPSLPTLFVKHGIEPLTVRLFPVSTSFIGAPADDDWSRRQEAVARILDAAPTHDVRTLGGQYLTALGAYARQAREAGSSFVEIQNTMLFATVGQKHA